MFLWITRLLSVSVDIVCGVRAGVVPEGLAAMLPGPELGAVLASVEVGAVPDASLLEVLSAQSRELAFRRAQVGAVMAEMGARAPMAGVPGGGVLSREQVFEPAGEETRAELVCPRRSA